MHPFTLICSGLFNVMGMGKKHLVVVSNHRLVKITPCDILLRCESVCNKLISVSLVSRCQGARQQALTPAAPSQVRWCGAQLRPAGHGDKPRTRPGQEAMLAGRTLPGMAWPWRGVGWDWGLRLKQHLSKQGAPKVTPRSPHPHSSFQAILSRPQGYPQPVYLGSNTRSPGQEGQGRRAPEAGETTLFTLSYSFSGYNHNKILLDRGFFHTCVCWLHYLLFFKRLPPKPLRASLSKRSNDTALLREWWCQHLTCHHGVGVSALPTRLCRVTVNEKQLTSDGRSLPPGWTEKNLEGPSREAFTLNVILSFDQGYLQSGLAISEMWRFTEVIHKKMTWQP